MRGFNGGALFRGTALVTVPNITYEWLVKQGACKSQLAKFLEVFGTVASIDSNSFRLAVLHGFDLDWVARRIFIGNTLLSYKLTWNRAQRHRDAALKRAWDILWSVVSNPVKTTEGCNAAFRMYEHVRVMEDAQFKSTWMAFYKKHGFS